MARNSVAYEEDFFAWTQNQARLLREGELSSVDAENMAEEIESMGLSDRREIRSRLIVLLAHLLKYAFQPTGRSTSWSGTLREQRRQLDLVLADLPSLRPFIITVIAELYRKARVDAAEETGLPEETLPAECPFSVEQILSENFLPQD